MPKINARKHLTNHINANKLAPLSAVKYEKLHDDAHAQLKSKCYDAKALKEWLSTLECTDGHRCSHVSSVRKVLSIRRPTDKRLPELSALVKYYREPERVKVQHKAASAKKFVKQERHRDVAYKELLRNLYETSIKIADFFDHERSVLKKGGKLPPCPHLEKPVKGINTKHYRQCAIWALVTSCNAPHRGEWPLVMIHDRIPEGVEARAWYKDGAITYNDRLKDPNNTKPNPVFEIGEVRQVVDEYIASLPEDQCYMVVNKDGEPYTIATFTSAIHKWTKAVHGENFGVNFLRTKTVEDNRGFIRGCIESEHRGHAPNMAFSHYATEPFKELVREEMAAEKENEAICESDEAMWTIEEE